MRSAEAKGEWLDAVMTSDLERNARLLTSYLLTALHEDHWVVSTTPESLAEATNEDAEWVREHWDTMLNSPFVERVGEGEWTLRLVFPEE